MPDIAEGETVEVQGPQRRCTSCGRSAACTRARAPRGPTRAGPSICGRKHLKAYRGDAAGDRARGAVKATSGKPTKAKSASAAGGDDDDAAALARRLCCSRTSGRTIRTLVGWWMSEKPPTACAPGGMAKQFISRLGNAFLAPAWFTKGLPSSPLDGDAVGGAQGNPKRPSPHRAQRERGRVGGRKMKYLMFDAPAGGRARSRPASTIFAEDAFGAGQHGLRPAPVEHVAVHGR